MTTSTLHFGPDGTCDCDTVGTDRGTSGPWACEVDPEEPCDICREGDGSHCRAGDWQPSARDLHRLRREAEEAGDMDMIGLVVLALSSDPDAAEVADELQALSKCRAAILDAAAQGD